MLLYKRAEHMSKLVSRSDDTYLVFLFTLPPHSTPMYMQVDELGSASGQPGQYSVGLSWI